MCISPLTIKNPYYGLGDKGINYLHNTTETHIQVPCGKCIQCISQRQGFYNQRIQMESIRSHLFMFTLTYNDESIPNIHIGEYNLNYPDWRDIQNMFKRIRKANYFKSPIRYLCVSEYGTKKHRPHYHGIICIEKEAYKDTHISILEKKLFDIILKEWRRNYGSTRKPIYKPLLTYVRKYNKRNYDLHHIIPVPNYDNDVSFYVTKYVLEYDQRIFKLMQKIKLDQNLTPEQSKELINKIKPRCTMSKDLGDWKHPPIKEYIKKCIARNDELPQFYDLHTGKNMLLSRYYRKHLLPVSFRLNQYLKSEISQKYKSFILDDDRTTHDYNVEYQDALIKLQPKLKKIQKDLHNKYK